MTYTEGRAEFEQMLAQHERALRQLNADYLTGLSGADRDALLTTALESAWEHREHLPSYFRPGAGLPKFWARCLRYAATSRERWLVDVATLPGVYERKWVLGVRLGEPK